MFQRKIKMTAKTAKSGKGALLTLPAEIKISNNAKLLEKLRSVLDKEYSKVTVDLGKVENADLSSLQILLSFYKECMLSDLHVEFKGPLDETLKKKLTDYGFIRKEDFREILFPFLGRKGAEIGNS